MAAVPLPWRAWKVYYKAPMHDYARVRPYSQNAPVKLKRTKITRLDLVYVEIDDEDALNFFRLLKQDHVAHYRNVVEHAKTLTTVRECMMGTTCYVSCKVQARTGHNCTRSRNGTPS